MNCPAKLASPTVPVAVSQNGEPGLAARRVTSFRAAAFLLLFSALLAGCTSGPGIAKDFDRDFYISGPIRLEISNASGSVQVTGSTDGRVHVHGSVRSAGIHLGNAQKTVDQIVANPPVELKADTVRIGKDLYRLHNISVAYVIEVPANTELVSSLLSGSQTVTGITGPAKIETASGSIHIDKISKNVQATAVSGSIEISSANDDVRANSVSGSITINNIKGDVRATTLSGKITVNNFSGRIQTSTSTGTVAISGATNDVKTNTTSGHITVTGNPSANGYWDIQNTAGDLEVSVPASSNFHLTASNTSGEISADIPLVIEEQSKHALRAHVGENGGRVELHTVSGKIHIRSAN